ncbi:MAG: ribulose-phosphate 3-epimerase [Bacteroidales bacterium]|jgi:ribulose-phosphate 3-epimerase|nr:ribulose-phosphate 3-epimerase [Bacteroidales bacterium]MDN5328988.1 ribulose-phosphate 3-epimerase [Bacteroidales bacterium]
MPLIAPSILTTDFTRLGETIEILNRSDADWIHLDIMDGRFVPNISFGFPVIQSIHKIARKPLDVHLMIVEPDKYLEAFKEAGADILTVHAEACPHLHRTIDAIKQLGMRAGVVLNPHSPLCLLENILNDVDLVLLMSVNPGFGGQKFISKTIDKIKQLKEMLIEADSRSLIEVDGGVTFENARLLREAGADVLVAGNTIFAHPDPIKAIKILKQS